MCLTPASPKEKVIIFSAPSGAGKSSIINRVIGTLPRLEFSISATCRAPRGEEKNGREYYFLSRDEFCKMAAAGKFIEWEEVYPGIMYGTLKSELNRIWDKGNVIVFDVDVKGGVSLKKIFGDRALSIFVMPPSAEELERRLVARGIDAPDVIAQRVAKAGEELAYAPQFDKIVVNDNLDKAATEAESIIIDFIDRK